MLFSKTKKDCIEKISTKSDSNYHDFKKNPPSIFINSVCFIWSTDFGQQCALSFHKTGKESYVFSCIQLLCSQFHATFFFSYPLKQISADLF